MFSGIIEAQAEVLKWDPRQGGCFLRISNPLRWADLKVGESIALNGVCLTLEANSPETLDFFVGQETLQVSNFSQVQVGSKVNLERSLKFGDRMHGHLVSGHVDVRGEVLEVRNEGECSFVAISFPSSFKRWIFSKGSIAVNGVSLTVNKVEDSKFEVFLIPETLRQTNLAQLQAQEFVNLEFDMMTKAVARQLEMTGYKYEQHP